MYIEIIDNKSRTMRVRWSFYVQTDQGPQSKLKVVLGMMRLEERPTARHKNWRKVDGWDRHRRYTPEVPPPYVPEAIWERARDNLISRIETG